jgi:biopolymer transport protein ExbD
MMDTWKVRHEGSPQHVETTFALLVQGLTDGDWEPTDEVRGPGESEWVAIEEHPALAEIAEDVEQPPPAHHDEEAHLDMNALIDVCMVMLIFFILTTSVAAMQKQMEAPTVSKDKAGVKVVTKEQVEASLIHVVAKMSNGAPVILVEGKETSLDNLRAALRGYASPQKTTLLLEHDDLVPQDTVVQIIDKAKAAGLKGVQMLVP